MAKCPYCNNEYNSGASYTAHVENCSYKNYDIQLIAQEKGTSVKNVRKEDLGEKAYQMSKQNASNFESIQADNANLAQTKSYKLEFSGIPDKTVLTITSSSEKYPTLCAVKMSSALNVQPTPIGWLYYNSDYELLYASGTPDNVVKIADWDETLTYEGNRPPSDYSLHVTDAGDIVAVFKGYMVSETLPVNANARQNPIIYPAGDYANPVAIDFTTNIKPTSWLQNAGICDCGDYFVFAEYTRPCHEKCYIWKVSKPFTTVSNWVKVKEFTLSGSNDVGFKHCHHVQRDPWTSRIYATTGDDSTAATIYESVDNAVTWSTVLGPSETYCRLLNFAFTEKKAYWATDSGKTDLHYLFEVGRNDSSAYDFVNIKTLYKFPNVAELQATYVSCYLERPNGILFLDRYDLPSLTPMKVYFWSFDTNSIHTISTINPTTAGNIGFRCEATNWHQSVDDRIICGFDLPNYNKVFRNTLNNKMGNLALKVVESKDLTLNLTTLYEKTIVKTTESISIAYNAGYSGYGNLTATYTIDGVSTSATILKGSNTWSVGTLTAGKHTLSIVVTDGSLTSNTLTFVITSTANAVNVISLLQSDWKQGRLSTGGAEEAATNRIRSIFIPLTSDATYIYNMDFVNYKVTLRFYNSSFVLTTGDAVWRTTTGTITTPANTKYLRIVVGRVDDADITPIVINSTNLRLTI